jgi:hypothetical protein
VYPNAVPQSVSISTSMPFSISAETLVSWVVTGKGNRIGIEVFRTALKISGMDVSSEEAECLVANQIHKGYMKGYISHEKQMVVLSNQNAFPKLADRLNPFSILYT